MGILELEKTSSSSNLPPKMIEILLSKLPSKSLLRFKTVSNSWNTMISDPVFIETHLKCSNSANNLFLNKYRDSEQGFTLVQLEGRKFQAQAALGSPNGYNVILCECNGVLLLRMIFPSVNGNYMMWNPSTRRKRYLICPYDLEGYSVNPEICYDPIADDFIVVFIAEKNYGIYYCKKDLWTTKKGLHNNISGGSVICVDGATYWVLWLNRTRQLVYYFDPKTDKLKRLPIPERLSEVDHFNVLCLRGSRCLYCIRDDDRTNFQIWIKEKGILIIIGVFSSKQL